VAKGTANNIRLVKGPSLLDHALMLARKGFKVFPLIPNSKLPLIDDYPHRATTDEEQIRHWWVDPVLDLEQPYNIGISTNDLLVVDVDNKPPKNGTDEIRKLETLGFELSITYTQKTPSGGFHYVYNAPTRIKNSVSVLGAGIDTRGMGGYIVGAGSLIEGVVYETLIDKPVVDAPAWLLEKCQAAKDKPIPVETNTDYKVDQHQAADRAKEYLASIPPAQEGARNQAGFATAAKLKDLGCSPALTYNLMVNFWKCEPMLNGDEVSHVIHSAFKYGRDEAGSEAPEKQFTPIVETKEIHPFDKLNEHFAFITAGGGHHILWETTDPEGRFKLEHLNEQSFHRKFAHWTMTFGEKTVPVTRLWITDKRRREYRGLCFRPGRQAPKGFYNLWRGFQVEPLTKDETPTPTMRKSVDDFLAHAKENVCGNDEALYEWLIGYFAHLIQKPGEKPLCALVFRGGKGVGKNALIERVGSLLGSHFLLTSNRRYLTSNFNGHLENCLLFALDEAFWSGDKQAEGTLKDLITGKMHIIEHKGKESYSVENCTRVVIIGNEDWLVPASHDERRFAVFDVGPGRKQDKKFFLDMREGMEAGGYRLLLRFFLDFDLSKVDVNQAPDTEALHDQKVSSLDPFYQWWLQCLSDGNLGSEFSNEWAEAVDTTTFFSSYRSYFISRRIKNRFPDERSIGKMLKESLPSVQHTKRRTDGRTIWVYKLPDLETARSAWDKFIGRKAKWE
jgi:hypothetical protein